MVLRAVEHHLQVLPYLLHRQLVVVVRAALVGPLLVQGRGELGVRVS